MYKEFNPCEVNKSYGMGVKVSAVLLRLSEYLRGSGFDSQSDRFLMQGGAPVSSNKKTTRV
jgi:hypothetical protein